jgi:hypothetical protein
VDISGDTSINSEYIIQELKFILRIANFIFLGAQNCSANVYFS